MSYSQPYVSYIVPLAIVILFTAGPVCAVASPQPFVERVDITTESKEILFSNLPGWVPETIAVDISRPPLYGSLNQLPHAFRYKPENEYWERGGDSFTYTLTRFDNTTFTFTLTLLPGLHTGNVILSEDFELQAPQSSLIGIFGSVTPSPEMAISGESGIQVAVNDPQSEAYLFWHSSLGDPNQGCTLNVAVPPPLTLPQGDFETLLLSARAGGASEDLLHLEMYRKNGQVYLRGGVRDAGMTTWIPTPSLAINPTVPHRVMVDFWPNSASPSGKAGAYLFVDGLLLGGFSFNHDFALENVDFKLGILQAPDGPITIGFDDLEVQQGPVGHISAVVLADSFEDIRTPSWTQVPALATSLGFSTEAAITGNRGVGVDLDETQGKVEYLLDDSPQSVERYSAKFLLNTQLAQILPCDIILLAAASDQNTFNSSSEHIKVRLRRNCHGASGFEIQTRGRHGTATGSGHWQDLGWTPITDGIHTIGFEWRAASGPNSPDGYLRLWIDGIHIGEISGLANQDRKVEAVLLGALGVDAGSAGSLALDGFESWSPLAPNS